jgi:hypothetical protein
MDGSPCGTNTLKNFQLDLCIMNFHLILPFDCDRVVANFLFFLNLFFRIHLFESCWDVPFCPGILYHTFSRIAGLFQHLNKFYQQQKKVDWISHRMAYLVFWFTTCKFHFLGLKVLRILGKKLKKTHFDAELKNYSLDLIKIFTSCASYYYLWLVEKSLQLNKGNMFKSPMSHIAPVPNSPGLPYAVQLKLQFRHFSIPFHKGTRRYI